MKKGEKMAFFNEAGHEEFFYVQEMTTLRGVNYLLVTETEDLNSDAYILREAEETESDLMFNMVDDEDELQALADIFEELIEEDEEGEDA